MENTLQIKDRVLVNKLVYDFRSPHRGEIIVFKAPEDWRSDPAEEDFIKRVIGVGGDHVVCCDAQHRLVVNGHSLDEPYIYADADGVADLASDEQFDITVPKGRLWVMGDHRSHSRRLAVQLSALQERRAGHHHRGLGDRPRLRRVLAVQPGEMAERARSVQQGARPAGGQEVARTLCCMADPGPPPSRPAPSAQTWADPDCARRRPLIDRAAAGARVLLLDAPGGSCCCRGFDPARPEHRYWFTVGGGLDEGESMLDAAARELLRGDRPAAGRPATSPGRSGTSDPSSRSTVSGTSRSRSSSSPVRRGRRGRSTSSGLNEIERASVDASGWWSLEELERDGRAGLPGRPAEDPAQAGGGGLMLAPPRTVVHRAAGLYALERTLQRRGFDLVAGADEAGRGACAGPLVVAAVVAAGRAPRRDRRARRLQAAHRRRPRPRLRRGGGLRHGLRRW